MKRFDVSKFGPNIGLVDEMYRRYLEAPDSVSEAWRDFFEDDRPSTGEGRQPAFGPSAAARPAPAIGAAAHPSAPAPAVSSSGGFAPSSKIRVRFRGPFAYVDAVVEGEVLPLCRLRYTGSAEAWGFAPYLASKDGYETSVLPNGSFSGPPEDGLDTACGLHLGDMSAWTDLFALRRSPPTH